LSVDAGGDISSAYLHMTHGVNRLHADGGLTRSRQDVASSDVLGSVFSIGAAQVNVNTRLDADLLTAFNSTALIQTPEETGGNRAALISGFYTYDNTSALRMQSLAGDVKLAAQSAGAVVNYVGPDTLGVNDPLAFAVQPGVLSLQALSRDVSVGNTSALFASDQGQLDIFAARDVFGGGLTIMSDAAASTLPDPLHPVQLVNVSDLRKSAASSRHLLDEHPSQISAGRDIIGNTFALAEPVDMIAGRDIVDQILTAQNLRPTDMTLVSAGRDFRYTVTAPQNSEMQVGGPGRFDVIAGRNVDLGFSLGVTTVGGLVNPTIPTSGGADLTIIAGLAQAPDFADFMAQVVASSAEHHASLIAYVEGELSQRGLSYESALTAFNAFNADDQRPFVMETFFRELVASGREANTVAGAGYKRGYAAIDALLPNSRPVGSSAPPSPYAGDLTLSLSRIYTLDGGDISLIVPGGFVNVGLANPPANLGTSRPPSTLGIVAQKAGDVRIFSSDDVLVNQSRVFTLGGGDIAVWSTTGDIDAGRGSKSAVSAPPPTVIVDATGQVTLDFAGAVAGSGIRTILTGDNVEPGDVDLIAPAGTVNAGDAGIGSAGNLNIAARQVVGLDNIQVGGTSTGVPADTSNLGASLSGVSSVASSASSATGSAIADSSPGQQAAPLAESALGWLDVFVEGFGDDVCKASDAECLKRNRESK